MRRALPSIVVLCGYWLTAASSAIAQAVDLPPPDAGFTRGPGSYLSVPKLLIAWFLFLLWVRTTAWVNHEVLLRRQNYALWNSAVFFPFAASFVLMWLIPSFGLGFLLMLVAYGAPLGMFIHQRNAPLAPAERVMTPPHVRFVVSRWLGKLGVKIAAEKQLEQDKGPPVVFTPQGAASDKANAANLLAARQSPGFLTARETFAKAIVYGAESILIDCGETVAAQRFELDGVWHEQGTHARSAADALVEVLKTFANLNIRERRAKQVGAFGAEYQERKLNCRITTQGVESGERVLIEVARTAPRFATLDELGMRAKVQEQFKELLGREKGFIIVSSMPGGGLSSTFDGILRSADRFMRDFVGVEEVSQREHEVENIQISTYDAARGESPATALPKLIRAYPNVYVVRDLVNAETVKMLCDEVAENRVVLAGIRAKESVEAVLRVAMLKPPLPDLAAALSGSLNVRLVRKLCEKCKVSYEPTAETLKQLGMPADKISVFYRPPAPNREEPEKICPNCKGIGYRGRTGVFELLVASDEFRNAFVKTPKLDMLKATARKGGMRTLQEEGLLLVAKGVTSLVELSRVLKQ